jgi:hypothetical protein
MFDKSYNHVDLESIGPRIHISIRLVVLELAVVHPEQSTSHSNYVRIKGDRWLAFQTWVLCFSNKSRN